MRGFIGHLEEGGLLPHIHKTYLWHHLHFNIEYNGDHVSITLHSCGMCSMNCVRGKGAGEGVEGGI